MPTTARPYEPADPPGPAPADAALGVASTPLPEQRARALLAWDGFRDIAAGIDPDTPSRLPAWNGRAVVAHLASWPDEPLLARLLAEARGTRPAEAKPLDQDTANAVLVDAHADATLADLLAALDDGRARLAAAFDAVEREGIGLARTGSQVGPVPLLTQLGAIAYELAVHAADLAPCGAPEADPALVDAGLLALADITGALAARHGLVAESALVGPDGGWAFAATGGGWTVRPIPAGGRGGPAVRAGSAALLLDASAGRRSVPPLLVKRELRLDNIPGLLALAPLLDHVPGLPGGPALRVAAGWLGGLGRAIGRIQR